MESSFQIFSVRGIGIRVHITFPLILVWAAIQFGLISGQGTSGAVFGVVVTLLLFSIVVLHELGHSIAAQRYGVEVKQILLLPIGGVAQLARIPDEPRQELVIAIAGPLVNFGLAVLLAIASLVFSLSAGIENPLAMLEGLRVANFTSVFNYVFVANLFLGLFNLLPAFPMDGGRVLRALLAYRLNYAQATAIAVAIGKAMAWSFGLWGFLGGGFLMIVVAIFIYLGADQEGRLVQLRNVLGKLTVGQAYSRQARSLEPRSTLREAVDLTLSTFQADFPVCEAENLVGLLTHTRLVEALNRYGPNVAIGEVMLTGVAPVSPQEDMFVVQQRLFKNKLDALPVVEEDCFLGMITSRDINELFRLISSSPDLIPASVYGGD